MLPSGLPTLRALGAHTGVSSRRNGPAPDADEASDERAPNGWITPDHPGSAPAPETPLTRDDNPPLAEIATRDVVQIAAEPLETRLGNLEDRLQELSRALELQSQTMQAELQRVASQLTSQLVADEARRDAALDRLRADILAAAVSGASNRRLETGYRHVEVSADLYARLARLEAALAAVTNPVLLPGELYLPPGEFLPEALVWENWNEVGERAFAFADAYSAHRLHLSEETRVEIGLFVTALRTRLTGSVYPNLQGSNAQQSVLRGALEEIASEMPRVRATLEREYRGEGSR
jgi:hypothetical protein